MTRTAWPIAASAGSPSYAAAPLRTTMAGLITPAGSTRPLGAISGRRVGGGLEVTVASYPTITIQPGVAILDVETPIATGPYLFSSDAVDTSLTGTAANGSNPRIDIVCVRLDDTDVDSSGSRQGIFTYTAGTAAASPSAPATPARSLRLCTILVPTSGGGSPSVTMDSTFAVASGGLLPVLSSARPSLPYEGQAIFELDTNRVQTYDGTNWNPFGTIASASLGSQQDASSVITLCTFSPTLVSGRRYRVTADVEGTQISSTGTPTVKLLTNGAEWSVGTRLLTGNSLAATTQTEGHLSKTYFPTSTAAVTFAITAQSSAGAFRVAAGAARLLLEDCGL